MSAESLRASDDDRRKIAALWQSMSSMFGHRWVSSYGAQIDPDRIWLACLRDISPDQIRFGLKVCRDGCLEWPPSAPEFRGMCLGVGDAVETDWEHKRLAAAEAEYRAALPDLNKVERGRELGVSVLAEMKNLFRSVGA
jgi:hypothetical protein